MEFNLLLVSGGSVLVALPSHLVFNRKEPTVPQFFSFIALLQVLLFTLWHRFSQELKDLGLLKLFLSFNVCYFAAFGSSIAIYRLFLHPLRNYPGPILGKLSKFHFSYICGTGNSHRYLEALHCKYGDIVRYGPNELSFVDPEDVTFLYGAQSFKLHRGPWYDGNPGRAGHNTLVMASTRNVENHKIRRRIWDKAFMASALKSYESRMIQLTDRLIDNCEGEDGGVRDISGDIDHFAFDVMGDLGFGEDFGMIEGRNKESLEWAGLLHSYMRMLSIIRPVPWFKELYKWLPIDRERKRNGLRFVRFTAQRFEARYERGQDAGGDIFAYLLQPDPKTGTKLTKSQVAEESVVVVVGGSDTSSICITFAFYYLLTDSTKYKRLQEEVDSLWDGIGELDGQQLVPSRAPYLNAVINESLRLAEPDPNGNQRATPKDGALINGKYIPEFTQLSIHKWSMQRDERNFSRALEFIPERWIDEEREKLGTLNHNAKAYIPFGAGVYSCVGKPLALLEMRLFITRFMRKLQLEPAPGYDLQQYPFEVTSSLTLTKTPLPVLVKKRKI
jgi:cytochrome P450 family 628